MGDSRGQCLFLSRALRLFWGVDPDHLETSDQGSFLEMTGVNIDVTEQRQAEEQSRYLMGELNHRTKNLLTVVQAIARNTVRSTDTGSFLDTFSARLAGLAASNNLLVSTD